MKVLFLIARNRVSNTNKCVIKCRITFNKQRKEFSTGLFVNPDNWNSKKQKVLDKESQHEYLNTHLSLITTKVNQAFLMLKIKEEAFAVGDVLSALLSTRSFYNILSHLWDCAQNKLFIKQALKILI